MKTNNFETPSPCSWWLHNLSAEHDPISDAAASNPDAPAAPVFAGKTGQPAGWVERTLLAVDTDRVFIDVSDANLRDELIAAFEADGRDVVAAANGQSLLEFMEKLPVPDYPSGDVVVVEDGVCGPSTDGLLEQLRARGWPILGLIASTRLLHEPLNLA
jgi:CheY-like chemotaxis protein